MTGKKESWEKISYRENSIGEHRIFRQSLKFTVLWEREREMKLKESKSEILYPPRSH